MQEKDINTSLIRTACRTVYDFQKLRVMNGNRIAGSFRYKLGQDTEGMTKEQLDEQSKQILAKVEKNYRRLTDGIVEIFGTEAEQVTRAKIEKRFDEVLASRAAKPTGKNNLELITTAGEWILIDNYMKMIAQEEAQFKDMERLLDKVPVYYEFLKDVKGCGAAMSAVLISEIDIHKAMYPSSLHKYAGLDVVQVVEFTNDAGKVERLSLNAALHDARFYFDNENDKVFFGAQECYRHGVGRNNHAYCLEDREYQNKEKETMTRKSITYSPFLKTKLLGVLAGSFLKAGGYRVDGKPLGNEKRTELAEKLGFVTETKDPDKLSEEVIGFLVSNGMKVEHIPTKYGAIYYNYKARLEHSPKHKEKAKIVKHRMATRYCIKMFLNDFYNVYRRLEGLPIAPTYAEAKLGIVHGEVSPGKDISGRFDDVINRPPSDLNGNQASLQ